MIIKTHKVQQLSDLQRRSKINCNLIQDALSKHSDVHVLNTDETDASNDKNDNIVTMDDYKCNIMCDKRNLGQIEKLVSNLIHVAPNLKAESYLLNSFGIDLARLNKSETIGTHESGIYTAKFVTFLIKQEKPDRSLSSQPVAS